MFALSNRGAGGEAPCKKKRCHPEGTSADVWCPKDLVLTELFLGQRGAITRKSAVNCRKSLIKHYVCTFYSQHKQNHCVILKLQSDFPFSYTFSFFGAVQTTSPAPRRAKNNLRVTRSFGGKAACGRRLRMTSFLLKGAAPPSPLLCECEHRLSDCIIMQLISVYKLFVKIFHTSCIID